MNKLRPPDFPGRNLPGRIRRGIPQKIRTGIGIPEKLPIFAVTRVRLRSRRSGLRVSYRL